MEQIRTKKRFIELTEEEQERELKRKEEEKERRIGELSAPELTQEEKELQIDIKMSLEEEHSEGYTIE